MAKRVHTGEEVTIRLITSECLRGLGNGLKLARLNQSIRELLADTPLIVSH